MKKLEIEYVDSLDLFQCGNYVRSFKSLEDVENYFMEDYEKRYKWEDKAPEKFVRFLNERNYTIIESKHLEFSEN